MHIDDLVRPAESDGMSLMNGFGREIGRSRVHQARQHAAQHNYGRTCYMRVQVSPPVPVRLTLQVKPDCLTSFAHDRPCFHLQDPQGAATCLLAGVACLRHPRHGPLVEVLVQTDLTHSMLFLLVQGDELLHAGKLML